MTFLKKQGYDDMINERQEGLKCLRSRRRDDTLRRKKIEVSDTMEIDKKIDDNEFVYIQRIKNQVVTAKDESEYIESVRSFRILSQKDIVPIKEMIKNNVFEFMLHQLQINIPQEAKFEIVWFFTNIECEDGTGTDQKQ